MWWLWSLISLSLQAIVVVVWGVLVWKIAAKYEIQVVEYLCGRWNPRDEIVQCGPGAEFQLNESQDKVAVVGWATVKYVFFGLVVALFGGLLFDTIVVKTILLFFGFASWQSLLLPDVWVITLALLLVEAVAAPFYWVATWRTLYTKIVGFTDGVYSIHVRESILALLVRLPPIYSGSYTPGLEMREIFFNTAGMPSLNETSKISWFEKWLKDLWVRLVCGSRQVGEVFLPSRAFKGSDLFNNFAYAANLSRILQQLHLEATFLKQVNDGYLKEVPALLLGAPGKPSFSRGEGEQSLTSWIARFRQAFPPGDGQIDVVNTRRKSQWDLKTGKRLRPSKYQVIEDAARAFAGQQPLYTTVAPAASSATPTSSEGGRPAFLQ